MSNRIKCVMNKNYLWWNEDLIKGNIIVVNLKTEGPVFSHQYAGCGCFHIDIPKATPVHIVNLGTFKYINPDWWYSKFHRRTSKGERILITTSEYNRMFGKGFKSFLREHLLNKSKKNIDTCSHITYKEVSEKIIAKVNKILKTSYELDIDKMSKMEEAFIPLKNDLALIWLNCD